MTTLATIPIDSIDLHPRNVRRDATADDELVASVKAQGILQPLGVVPADDRYLLIAGHRRHAAATAAGITTVPVVVLDHLDTDAKQLEAMLVENGRRLDLTPAEEADAYEQLTLLGVKAPEIAQTTGRDVKTVRARLKLSGLSEKAKTALHQRQVSIEDALDLAKLASEPNLLKEAEKALGTQAFRWKLHELLQQQDRLAEHRKLRAEYAELGLTELPKKPSWVWGTGPVQAHSAKDADAWWPGRDTGKWDDGPVLVQSKVKKSRAEAKRDKELAERQAKQRAEAEAAELARRLRLEHVADLATGLRIPAATLAHVRVGVARLVASMTKGDQERVLTVADVTDTVTIETNDYRGNSVAHGIVDLSTLKLLRVLLTALAQVGADATWVGWGGPDDHTLPVAEAYWAAFDATSYQLPDVDLQKRAALQPQDAATA